MSKSYLLTLQPLEPYFFGNEKTFSFDPRNPGNNRYFIKSERMPMQTTVLGALRYLLMPVKNADYRYTRSEKARNDAIVGAASFQIGSARQSFGAIEGISPVFLARGDEKYVRTPFDHKPGEKARYTPMTQYALIETDQGVRWYSPEYSAKSGISDSYMNVDDGTLKQASELFQKSVRVGVSKGTLEKAFFKKQFSQLADGWSFAAYVSLNVELLASDPLAQAALKALEGGTVVYLGQNKSTFILKFKPEENKMEKRIGRLLRPGTVYCFGDALVPGAVYDTCLFAAAGTRDYRAFHTVFRQNADQFSGGISKSPELCKLICAGSVLIPADRIRTLVCFQNENCQTIGFNITVSNTEDGAK